jgi:DNA primase
MPIAWDELATVPSGAAFDLAAAAQRAAAADPWRAYAKTRQSIGPARLKKAQAL